MSTGEHGPLSGLRVVDMSTTLMGPYCGLLLAQLGADVVKFERPGGDIARDISDRSGRGLGDFYVNFNRGKRSVVLDVNDPADAEVLRAMISDADVFSHNLRPTSARKLGLSYESLATSNPQLVYCSMHGFDQRGPWRGARPVAGHGAVAGQEGRNHRGHGCGGRAPGRSSAPRRRRGCARRRCPPISAAVAANAGSAGAAGRSRLH
mgnify:CR=1 FL=1